VEVREGLAPGDMVVTGGLLKIRDGVPVQPQPAPAAVPPTAEGAKPEGGPG
jgi:hypothetical protein